MFEAETGTDLCPGPSLRRVYRLGQTEGFVKSISFVLVGVDIVAPGCVNDKPWSTVWESPKGPESTIVR